MATPLYDNYNAINSRMIRPYQGSTIPELVQVSQEMQRRYDEAQTQQDYISRFMNNLQALPGDEPALREMADRYKTKLKEISSRPDLENTLRETTMLARDVPDEYAPFAARMKEQQEYEKALMDRKDLLPESRAAIIAMSRAQYQPMQKDPMTGKYVGKYKGYDAVDDIDFNKKIKEYVEGAHPTSKVWKSDSVNGEWIIENGGKQTILDPKRIQEIVRTGMKSDPQMQAWLRQQQDLGTYNVDWKKLNDFDVNSKPELSAALKPYIDQGMSVGEAARQYSRDSISANWQNKAMQYAVPRFVRNDTESTSGLSSNTNFWNALNRQDKLDENRMLQVANTMTIGGAKIDKVEDFTNLVNGLQESQNQNTQSYADWLKGVNDGIAKYKKGDRVFYKDADGKEIDVTQRADEFRSTTKLYDQRLKEMKAVDDYAAQQSGWNKVPKELKDKAQSEYNRVMNEFKNNPGLDKYTAPQMKQQRAQEAYDNVMKNTKVYKDYQNLLKQKLQGTDVGSDLFAFSAARSESIGKVVENMVRGLGAEGGMVPVWDKEGKQLHADTWNEMKGDMKGIGVTYTGDPASPVALVMRVYKDVKGKSTAGEDMIVKLPNTNIEAFIQNDMDPGQRYYLNAAKNLAMGLNNPSRTLFIPAGAQGNKMPITIKGNSEDPRGGWKVKVGTEERTMDNFKDIINFMTKQ